MEGAAVVLRPKTFALLIHLADRAGSVVGKQELMDAVWPGLVVTDDSLTQAVSELRSALDDREQQLIRTLPRRGYMLDAAVRPVPPVGPGTGVAIPGPVASTPIGSVLSASRSLAIMPFTDLSDPPAPHLAQAVDTSLITDLARLADTRVVPRGSASALGTSSSVDLRRAERELGVQHVVTGTVERAGKRLHVTAQLVRISDGALLWADRFDYASAADWVERRDISARIANQLDLRMRDALLQQARNAPPDNEAVDQWMRGAFIMSRIRTKPQLLQARAHFEAALALQPDSSHALAGLAATGTEMLLYRWADRPAMELECAERLARRALEVDPQNQEAMMALANALMFSGRLADAMPITQKHLSLNPNDSRANRDLAGQYHFQGRWEEAVNQLEVAIRLNPLDSLNIAVCHNMASASLLALRCYDECIARARLAVDGPRAGSHDSVAAAEAWRGNLDAARAHAAAWLRSWPGVSIEHLRAQRGSKEPAYLAGMEHYYEGLRRAGIPERPAQQS
jgi:TolB-like protein